MISEDS